MTTRSLPNNITPDEVRRAIQDYFACHTSQEIVARAEALTPTAGATVDQPEQSLSRMATEAGWLLMVCDKNESQQAIVFALGVCRKLADLKQLIADSAEQHDAPTMINIHSKRMLVSQPTTLAKVLDKLVESSKFKEIERDLLRWASSPEEPLKEQLLQMSQTFARIAPILEENAI